MADDIEFIDGLIVKAPNQGAPDYVKAKISIKRAELIAWLQARDGDWINVEVKESKGGKYYAAVDNWKPNQNTGNTSSSGPRGGAPARERPARATDAPQQEFVDNEIDDIPFLTNRANW